MSLPNIILSPTLVTTGVETGGSGGSMNRGPELLRAPSGVTQK